MRCSVVLAAILAASCGVRPPTPVDLAALVRMRGAVDARGDLLIRIIEHPRDVAPRLALAELDETTRPAEAIDQLETVLTLGGPLGTRWHGSDRARLGRLLLARGRVRLARGAASARDDLERAKRFGAAVRGQELVAARVAVAIGELRHVDAEQRAAGRAILAELSEEPSWAGAKSKAAPADRAAFGAWLWPLGARREAYEQLAAWHDVTPAPRDLALETAYLRALAWWSPMWLGEVQPPPPSELVGAERCRFPGALCDPRDTADDVDAGHALLGAPLEGRTDDPSAATAYAVITLREALHGDGGWGRLLSARVDVGTVYGDHRAAIARPARAIFARLVGQREASPSDGELDSAPAGLRLVGAAERALEGGSLEAVQRALGPVADTPDGRALIAQVTPAQPDASADPLAEAAAHYAATRSGGDPAALGVIARAFRRDPAIAERLGRELVAASSDAASAHATVGALFDALGDLARARIEWQAAVDASWEPALARALAETEARAGDADAALVNATAAAAASGDPAVVWNAVAHALLAGGRAVEAMTAARDAIDLAGPDALAEALDLAIAASHTLGRDAQVIELEARRARLAPPAAHPHADDDPTDAPAALASLRRFPSATTIARAWVASRWNPRAVELRSALLGALDADDPRRATLVAELVALAGDPDRDRALVAVEALRR